MGKRTVDSLNNQSETRKIQRFIAGSDISRDMQGFEALLCILPWLNKQSTVSKRYTVSRNAGKKGMNDKVPLEIPSAADFLRSTRMLISFP